MRGLIGSLWLLVRRPSAWSARHYARKNRMDLVALRPDAWRPLRTGAEGSEGVAERAPIGAPTADPE